MQKNTFYIFLIFVSRHIYFVQRYTFKLHITLRLHSKYGGTYVISKYFFQFPSSTKASKLCCLSEFEKVRKETVFGQYNNHILLVKVKNNLKTILQIWVKVIQKFTVTFQSNQQQIHIVSIKINLLCHNDTNYYTYIINCLIIFMIYISWMIY